MKAGELTAWAGTAFLLLACLNNPGVTGALLPDPSSFAASFPAFLPRLGTSLLLLVAAAAYAALIAAAGRAPAGLVARRGEEPVWGLAAGLVAFGLLLLGLGLAGLLYPALVFAFLAVAALTGLRRGGPAGRPAGGVLPLRGGLARYLYGLLPRPGGIAGWWPVLLLVPAVPRLLAGPLLPPTNVDILEYHIAYPELWSRAHRIFSEPGLYIMEFPLLFERLALPFVQCGIPGGVAAFHMVLLALGAVFFGRAVNLAVMSDERGVMNERGDGLPPSSLITHRSSFPQAGWLFLGGGFLVMAWEGHPDTGLLFAAGLGALALARRSAAGLGLACAVLVSAKHQGFALAATFLAAGTLAFPGWRRAARSVAFAASLAAVPAIAWMARAALDTGNPVFPFLGSVFRSLGWAEWNSLVLWRAMGDATVDFSPVFPDEAVREFLLLPWRGAGNEWFSPFTALLYLSPLALLSRGAPRAARALALQALLFGLLWAIPSPKFGRYLVPAAATALASFVMVAGPVGAPARVALLAAVLIPGQALFTVRTSNPSVAPEGVLLGRASSEDYARARLGGYLDAVGFLNTAPPDGRRVLVVGQGYGYGLKARWLANNELGKPAVVMAFGEDLVPGRFSVAARQANVGRVLYNPVRAFSRSLRSVGQPMPDGWVIAYGRFWSGHMGMLLPPRIFDWTGYWCVFGLSSEGKGLSPEGKGLSRTGKAREVLRGSRVWLPGTERFLCNESDILMRQADEALLRRQWRLMGDFGASRFQRALHSYAYRGAKAEAYREAAGAWALGMRVPVTGSALGALALEAGKRSEAATWARRVLEVAPGNERARSLLESSLVPGRKAAPRNQE